MIIREHDCGTDDHIVLPIRTQEGLNKVTARPRPLGGRALEAAASGKPGDKNVVAEKGQTVTVEMLEELETWSSARSSSCRSARC